MASGSKELSGLLGSGSKKIPWQAKLIILGIVELILWALAGDWALFVCLSALAIGVSWACFKDMGNVLLTLAVLIFSTLLVGTRMGGPMNQVSGGVKAVGAEGLSAVGDMEVNLPERTDTTPTTAPAPPTTALTVAATP